MERVAASSARDQSRFSGRHSAKGATRFPWRVWPWRVDTRADGAGSIADCDHEGLGSCPVKSVPNDLLAVPEGISAEKTASAFLQTPAE